MASRHGLVWKCPICDAGYPNDWRLSTHIAGMASAYNEYHRKWAEDREPDLDYQSLGTVGSMLRPFVLNEVNAQGPLTTPIPPQVAPNLLSNLVEGYELVAALEMRLCSFVFERLKANYGDEEWWTKGIPMDIRKHCRNRSEEDDNRYDYWLYLNFIDLETIIGHKDKWPLFLPYAESIPNFAGKKQFLQHFRTLNNYRNQIMHPIKGRSLEQDDFAFLRNFSDLVNKFTEAQ